MFCKSKIVALFDTISFVGFGAVENVSWPIDALFFTHWMYVRTAVRQYILCFCPLMLRRYRSHDSKEL